MLQSIHPKPNDFHLTQNPVPPTTTKTQIRVRENQRRSRARRAELIQDLQNRVREFERQGIAATQEVQRAARDLALENARLRELLGLRERFGGQFANEKEWVCGSCGSLVQGVGGRDGNVVDHVVGNDVHSGLAIQEDRQRNDYISQYLEITEPASSTDTYRPLAPTSNTYPNTSIFAPTKRIITPIQDHQQYTEREASVPFFSPSTSLSPPTTSASDLDPSSECPNTLNCFCAPDSTTVPASTPSQSVTASGTEISCETAARIISEMRGRHSGESTGGHLDAIWDELGCRRDDGGGREGRRDCSVKNSVVLQIMDC